MSDDLFSRFRGAPGASPTVPSATSPTSTPAQAVDDASGLAYRQIGNVSRLSEVEVLGAIERIPSMPIVVQKLLARSGNQAASTADLEDLIKQDMGLAGRLLKLVNSPFYGLGKQISSINQAVAIIGLASLKSLAVAASTSNILAVDLAGYGYADKGLWVNSCATAALAKAVAQRNGATRDDAEEYFVAGLLRDIGMLVLGPFLAQKKILLRKIVAPKEDSEILRREREALGFDHCWAGEKVAEKWTLPEGLRLVIGHHHRIPPDASMQVLRRLAGVRLAERLTYNLGVGVLKDHPFNHQIDALLIQAAGLNSAKFQELLKDMPDIIAKSDLANV
jgi:HD-like signal output (HDOD) protein